MWRHQESQIDLGLCDGTCVLVSRRALLIGVGVSRKIMQDEIQTRHQEQRNHRSKQHAVGK